MVWKIEKRVALPDGASCMCSHCFTDTDEGIREFWTGSLADDEYSFIVCEKCITNWKLKLEEWTK